MLTAMKVHSLSSPSCRPSYVTMTTSFRASLFYVFLAQDLKLYLKQTSNTRFRQFLFLKSLRTNMNDNVSSTACLQLLTASEAVVQTKLVDSLV